MGVAWWNLQSQLLVAIQKDDASRAKELLAGGVDCDARFLFGSHRRPALCLCVERDSLDLGEFILPTKINIQVQLENNWFHLYANHPNGFLQFLLNILS